ncbi:MAG: glycosyltransferase family 4 protein [Anaerolineae bacterium]
MRIGLVIYGTLETLSGGFYYDHRLVEQLRHRGDKIEIFSLPWSSYGRHLAHNFWPDFARRLRDAEIDLLLQDELNHPSLFWLNRRMRPRVTYPIASIVHHLRSSEARPAWQNKLYRLVERAYLTSVDGFIFNSQTTRQAVERMAQNRPSVVVTPAGDRFRPELDEEAIIARAHEPGPLRLLFVGNLIRRKGLHLLLAALARLPRDAWRLEVAGGPTVDPGYPQTVRRQIAASELNECVTLHGRLSDDELARLLQHSQLLAVPSSYEGFGIVYLEGMGFGLPAIAGSRGGAAELITEGQNGFLLPAQDAAVLARHVLALHHDRDRLAEMGVAARRRYLAHPGWEESLAAVRPFLLALCHQDRRE